MANKTLTLEYVKAPFKGYKDPDLYKVITVTNSVAYKPGELLEKNVVNNLCSGKSFSVKIK